MKNVVGAFLIAVVSGPVLIADAGPVGEEWVARYNGPANRDDGAEALALDAAGNVYVTGWSVGTGYDYATVKYDTDGNELWVARYNGGVARALAVDAAGNVYVTGESDGYTTVKYDTNGNELWVAHYNPGFDRAKALALDGAGNVYVTGLSSSGIINVFDYGTVKYDTDGNELWVARYNGTGHGFDQAHAIAVDADGNVYVTGESPGVLQFSNYATVKYDTNGNELWVARYSGPRGSDAARALAVDATGNVYVTGESLGIGTGWDYATVKYDTDGNELWVARYDGPIHGNDFAYAIALDAAGAIYVTGSSSRVGGGGFYDYTTVKYNPDGTEVWVARYSGLPGLNRSNVPTGIALDPAENVYVTGSGGGHLDGYHQDYATVKYDNDGNELWVIRYEYPVGQNLAKANCS